MSEWLSRWSRMLAKPSSELQGDAVGVQVTAFLVAVVSAALFAWLRAPAAAYVLPVAALAVSLAATWVALRKLRFERSYGEFYSGSPAVASVAIHDASGALLVRPGVDSIGEMHVIGHTGKLARMSRDGLVGRLQVMVEVVTSIRAQARDIHDPFWDGVCYLVVYSDLTAWLFKMGFVEIPDPPRFSFFNRAEKRLLLWKLALMTGRDRELGTYRMAYISREQFGSPETLAALDAQVARAQRALERARAMEAQASLAGK